MRQGIKFIIYSLILVLVFAPAFDAHGSLPQKRVLLLYSEDKAHPAHELTDGGSAPSFGRISSSMSSCTASTWIFPGLAGPAISVQ